jgi:hypothetical protein
MTREQIQSFVERLVKRDVSGAELAALSLSDLTAINLHLLENRRAVGGSYREFAGPEQFVYGSMVVSREPRRTYSEAEILAELGIYE